MLDILNKLLNDSTFRKHVMTANRKIHANKKILQQGTIYRGFYLIVSGSVRIQINNEANEKLVLHPGIDDLGPSDIFGELGLFDELPANADVVSITETELIEIDKKSFRRYLENNPQVGYDILLDILQTLISRLRKADNKIIHLYEWGVKAHNIDKHLE